MTGARELLEAARMASDDYSRCEMQLLKLRLRNESLGGGISQPPAGGGNHDPIGDGVAALVDAEGILHRQMVRDERIMTAASTMLFGGEDVLDSGGLYWLVDDHFDEEPDRFGARSGVMALWWYYLQGETWDEVGRTLGYSRRQVVRMADDAVALADEYGLALAAIDLLAPEDVTRCP